jgi:D-arabinose 1-dehydrogenase-like Zn-dependent alcohol dehydrogenase
VLAAVVLALAGARRGDPVATVGTGALTTASLLAASSTDRVVAADARVVVAGAAYDVPAAVALLAPGGRLVAVAADAGSAQRLSASHGLLLRHVVPVDGRLAWSATLAPPP